MGSLLQKEKFWYPKEQGQHYYKNLYVHTSMQTYILTTGKKSSIHLLFRVFLTVWIIETHKLNINNLTAENLVWESNCAYYLFLDTMQFLFI